jgi:hypothetical protein
MRSFISALDCERFGCKIAKIHNWENKNIKTILDQCKDQKIKLIITKVKSHQLDIINALEYAGFRIKDSQVTYHYPLHKLNFKTVASHPDVRIRAFEEADKEAIISIAKESFVGYGHYYADERLDKDKCSEIYPDWARRSCEGNSFADKIWVAEFKQHVAGFLSFKKYKSTQGEYAAGGIGAVAMPYRKYGVFRSLVKQGLLWGAEIGLIWEEHNVLTTNYAVNHVFSSAGFGIVNSFMTLHGWLDE